MNFIRIFIYSIVEPAPSSLARPADHSSPLSPSPSHVAPLRALAPMSLALPHTSHSVPHTPWHTHHTPSRFNRFSSRTTHFTLAHTSTSRHPHPYAHSTNGRPHAALALTCFDRYEGRISPAADWVRWTGDDLRGVYSPETHRLRFQFIPLSTATDISPMRSAQNIVIQLSCCHPPPTTSCKVINSPKTRVSYVQKKRDIGGGGR